MMASFARHLCRGKIDLKLVRKSVIRKTRAILCINYVCIFPYLRTRNTATFTPRSTRFLYAACPSSHFPSANKNVFFTPKGKIKIAIAAE